MEFTNTSFLVMLWKRMVLLGEKTTEDIPDLYNLKDKVLNILPEELK